MGLKRLACTMGVSLALLSGCTDSIGSDTLDSREQGRLSRLFDKLSSIFVDKAEEDAPVAPNTPWEAPAPGEDPVVDELFDALGLEEVDPGDEEISLDGALVGMYEHFPDENDPDDYYDSVCFFAKSPDQMPSVETLFYAEMYGFRPDGGGVSDIHGKEIERECVWCDEGNTGGDETRVIFYVNGILTESDTHCDTLQAISDKTGAVTIGVMNESEGAIKDVWQTASDRFTVTFERTLERFGIDQTIRIHENKAATMLMNLVVQRIRSNKRVEIWAHSQGGAVTSLALHRALRALQAEDSWPVMRDGEIDPDAIKVVTFGSASPKWPHGGYPKGPNYTHYVHLRDATPSALGVGAWGKFLTLGEPRAGEDANMVFFDGNPADREELHPDDDTKVFSEIPVDEADVALIDLNPTKYHDIEGCYLEMFEEKNGAWHR